jgi:hypothetical protein
MDLYVLGGVQRAQRADAEQEWRLFERAVVARVQPETGVCEIHSFESPPEARAAADSSVLFKSGAIAGDRLYACTSTEIIVYQLPGFRTAAYLSLPFFNDLHHVRPTRHGTLMVAVTGLDLVAEVTLAGELVQSWSATGGDAWARFSPAIDYRKVSTLKPYQAHVNYVFEAQGEWWATRGDLGDAICLADPRRRIHLGVHECVHDGWAHAGRLYFTCVDGRLIVVNEATLRVEDMLSLEALEGGRARGYSWCRGVLPVDEQRVWIGFTRLRKTRWMEKLRWAKSMVAPVALPTRLSLYDLARRELVQEVNLEAAGMHAVFNALPAEQQPAGAGTEATAGANAAALTTP